MPTITLNKKVFEKLVGKKLPLEELKDRISMLGTDLEKIEDNEIVVEVFPNRPDLLSEQGFARAFASFIGEKTGLRDYAVKRSGDKVIVDSSVDNIRPFTACAIVKKLKFDEETIREVIQIQEKLHVTFGRNRKKLAIGIYPMEKIKFPITYSAEDPNKIKFKPLEANREMTGLQVLGHHKAGREYGYLLENLDKFPVFRDATGEVLSMPPIINSDLMGKVTEETKEVFIECSGFDFEALNKCLNMIVTALAEMGGEIYSLDLEYPQKNFVTPNLFPDKMKFNLSYANQRLGLDLTEKEAKELLEKMGYGYDQGTVLVPSYRADILHQIDLVEDIAIAYGYENFEEIIPEVATIGAEDKLEKFFRKVRDILVGLKLLEVKNYHLLNEIELNAQMLLDEEIVGLKSSTGDYNHLRNYVLPSLMKNLNENQHNEFPQNIFEIGRTFVSDKGEETGVKEKEHLSVVLCHDQVDFTEIKQILDVLMKSLGLECSVKESKHNSFIPGRVGDIMVGGKKIGVVGELSPEVLTNWDLMVPVVSLELNLEDLFEKVFP
ncbi:phenylalanine--tRNA ligase subunit beta [Candidatus Woesearchaeota archaeon]|nr:phenylalanine--tRNA ligase subunit beta [Candidatus Woesearchaeota archaeon]